MLRIPGTGENFATQLESFEEATKKGNYNYWLTEEDISDIARIEYNSFKHPTLPDLFTFETSGSIDQLKLQIESFKALTHLTGNRLTLIINLGNLHWVTLVIVRHFTLLEGFYIDSLGNLLPDKYFKFLKEYGIKVQDLSIYAVQQTDRYNCGLWALENSFDLNSMLDSRGSLAAEQIFDELINALKRPRNRFYFNSLRRSFTQKFYLDRARVERYQPNVLQMEANLPEIIDETRIAEIDVAPKRVKVQTKASIDIRLERFVECFMDVLQKKIAACYLIASGKKLSIDALKQELKVGASGALFGFIVSQGLTGAIPSLVASLRTVSNHYYMDKSKAQKITQIFSGMNLVDLSPILAESATGIFVSYEAQFMQVTDKAGDTLAMEKLAEDAVVRLVNYIAEEKSSVVDISVEFITKAIILGNSDKYFDPSLKKFRLSTYGNAIQDDYENKIYTADLFENVGLFIFIEGDSTRLYNKAMLSKANQYGYRRVLSWEKNSQGGLIEAHAQQYKQVVQLLHAKPGLQYDLQSYQYVLDSSAVQAKAQTILSKLINRARPLVAEKFDVKKSILFDLRNPVENFIGRKAALDEIHQTLLAGRTPAIVSAMSALNSDKEIELTSGSQASVSGLGGVGKTQLALRYAQLYVADYDNNVLWINCDTKVNLSRSFLKLAEKLDIETKDSYGEAKALEAVVEEIYEYFSDSKSLFIFDNVDNYREIELFLPKSMLGNKPHLLITSRYRNWQNTASVISLEVFTEQETSYLLKQALSINDNLQDLKINELNYVLQGLPLALQQAIAYIKTQRNVNSDFDIEAYLEIFKEKRREILDFNFRTHSNDPYLNTVYTAWQVTLEKIKEAGEVGQLAIELLNTMSFIYPESIYVGIFTELYDSEKLSLAMELLKVYSMINVGSISSEYVMHRLVQKVVNLSLQYNTNEFRYIARRAELLVMHYRKNRDLRFHYLFFLLNVVEHPELEPYLTSRISLQKFSLILMVDDSKVWTYFFDIIYTRFTKQRYIDFLSEAFLSYRKEAAPFYIHIILRYIEEKFLNGILNKSDLLEIIDNVNLVTKPSYRINRYSREPGKRAQQIAVKDIIISFKKNIFPEAFYEPCLPPKRKKRYLPARCELAIFQKERKQQKFARHVERVSQVASVVSTGLFTKDIVSAFIQGDFESVAINSGLLLNGQLFGKLSNALLVEGEKLTKRRFLGKMLKVAAPFVKRGTFFFFAYNLCNDVKAYQSGDSNQLGSIVFNGAIVSIDGIETGIEMAEGLDLFTDVAIVTGPIGETLTAFIWLGTESYEINRGLGAIEQQLDLTFSEKIIQGLRLFFHMGSSKYIELKIQNNNLTQFGLSFLKEHRDIQRFIFSAAFAESALRERSEVRLDKQFNLTLSESMPDDPSEGQLFCAEGDIATQSVFHVGPRNEKTNFYFCKKAMGIEYAANRTGNATLIALNKGDDEAIVKLNFLTIFLVGEGNKRYKGSDKGNLFIMQGNRVTGLLEGGKGIDVINLENFYANTNASILLDRSGFLCEKNLTVPMVILQCGLQKNKLGLKNIDHICGRTRKKDVFFLTKNMILVDGKGGEDEANPDIIYITNEAEKGLKIILRANTVVYYIDTNLAPNPIDYIIPCNQQGKTEVKFPFQDNLQQRFFFECFLENITAITIENNRIQFNFSASPSINFQRDLFSLTLQDEKHLSTLHNNTFYVPENAYYIFNGGIELKLLDEKHIYARVENIRAIDEVLDSFIIVANQIKKSFSIQFVYNQTALIGSKKSEIFTTDCLTESYLIGNGGKNIYKLLPLNTTFFPLPEVTLYDVSTEEISDDFRDTLDLREVSKKAKHECPLQWLSISLSQEGNDLVLKLNTDSLVDVACQRLNMSWPIARIRFEKALLAEWYQKVDIVLEDNQPMQIFYTKAKGWFLSDTPLAFDEDKEIIVLTNRDINQGAELILFKNVGNFTFFNQNETDLIVTNAQDLHTFQYDIYTIIFSEFYQLAEMREKVFSSTFIFLNETLCLKDYAIQIDTAASFSSLLSYYRLLTNSSTVNRTERSIQKPAKVGIAQKWLENKAVHGNTNYLGWAAGVTTIALSTMMLIAGKFFIKRHRSNVNSPIALATVAISVPLLQASVVQAIPGLPLLALRNEFSIVNQCVKSETLIGLLGICVQQKRVIYWEQAHEGQAVNFESYLINRTEHNSYYLDYENRGQWVLDLNRINKVALAEIYFQLPPAFYKRLRERKYQQQVFVIWQQQMATTLGHYVGNVLTLHTPIGNLFKAVGLSPDWRARDDIHFLIRFWITTQQLLSYQSAVEKSQSLLAGLLEIALLQPRTQITYAYLNRDFSKAKPVIRLIADLLQLGFYNFSYLVRILQWFFPNNESVWKISLGLHMVNSFYRLTGDLSSWYLGMALFVLPYLPVLLENIGIPITRGLHEVCNKLAQVFIGQSVLNKLSADDGRIEQQNRELLLADERVKNGRSRLKCFTSSAFSFFAQNDSVHNLLETKGSSTYGRNTGTRTSF